MSKRISNTLYGIAALLVGGMLYLLFREHTRVSEVFNAVSWIGDLRAAAMPFANGFLKYYLPDFLWAFSLGCFLIAAVSNSRAVTVLCGSGAFLCGSIWEILQLLDIVSGTFDFLDMAMYFLAGFICIVINLKERVQ